MLQNKATVLNQLFDLDMHFSVQDRSIANPAQTGTQAKLSFNIVKIQHAPDRQRKLDKYQQFIRS